MQHKIFYFEPGAEMWDKMLSPNSCWIKNKFYNKHRPANLQYRELWSFTLQYSGLTVIKTKAK